MSALSDTADRILEDIDQTRRALAELEARSPITVAQSRKFSGERSRFDDPSIYVAASDLELLVRCAVEPDVLRLLVELAEQYEELTEDEAVALIRVRSLLGVQR